MSGIHFVQEDPKKIYTNGKVLVADIEPYCEASDPRGHYTTDSGCVTCPDCKFSLWEDDRQAETDKYQSENPLKFWKLSVNGCEEINESIGRTEQDVIDSHTKVFPELADRKLTAVETDTPEWAK